MYKALHPYDDTDKRYRERNRWTSEYDILLTRTTVTSINGLNQCLNHGYERLNIKGKICMKTTSRTNRDLENSKTRTRT